MGSFGNELVFAGIEGAECVEPGMQSHDTIMLTYSSVEDKERVGPIQVALERPGYQLTVTSVWAPRVVDRVPVQLINLQKDTGGWGDVEVTVVGMKPAPGIDVLIRLYAPNEDCALIVHDPGSGRRLFHDVPAGHYRVSAKMSDGLFVYPKPSTDEVWSLDVVPGQTSRLELDVSGRSTVHCVVVDATGRLCSGPMIFRIMGNEVSGWTRHVTFENPPYSIPGFRPGRYFLSAIQGRRRSPFPDQDRFRMAVDVEDADVDVVFHTDY